MRHDFDKLTARDIMQTDIINAEPHDSLQETMAVMLDNHVTGLPVIDRKGRCVGVVSATDILNFEQEHAEETIEGNAEMARYFDPDSQRWEDVRVAAFAMEELSEMPVSEVMCRDLVSVGPEASLEAVALKMTDEDIHRVLVLDAEQNLLGMISSVDFVRLFAA